MLAPFMAFLAVCIVLFDSRPVFFVQKRVGRDGKEFKMIKFRTMLPDSDIFKSREAYQQASARGIWKKTGSDPRITPFGKLLRRSSLDELPQLFNVLIGHMSIVGPRPLPALYMQNHDRFAETRSLMRPGITGLWQVNNRKDTRIEAMAPHDIRYVREFSFAMDLKILIKTMIIIVRHKDVC
jgi:lipopolysaccharide/colanic/teichoic acid biosynthesis glycosyltransferase